MPTVFSLNNIQSQLMIHYTYHFQWLYRVWLWKKRDGHCWIYIKTYLSSGQYSDSKRGNFHISCMFNQFSCIPLQSTLITNMLAEIDVLFDVHEDFYERVREWEEGFQVQHYLEDVSDYLFVLCLFLTLFVQIFFSLFI